MPAPLPTWGPSEGEFIVVLVKDGGDVIGDFPNGSGSVHLRLL